MTAKKRPTADQAAVLADDVLLVLEQKLWNTFRDAERILKKRRGVAYDRLQWPAETLSVWDTWSRVHNITLRRGLNPLRATRVA